VKEKTLAEAVTIMVTSTLCIVVLSMVAAMLIGLFDNDVSNDKIFEVITPAFQVIIGGFIGLITGIKIGQEDNDK
jgi:undecaprenyl pyrophosphate phosphatase UppP